MTIAQTWVIIQFKYIPSGKTECKSWYLNKKLYFHARAFDLPSVSIRCMFICLSDNVYSVSRGETDMLCHEYS